MARKETKKPAARAVSARGKGGKAPAKGTPGAKGKAPPRTGEGARKAAANNPGGVPLSGRDPRFHSPDAVEEPPAGTPWYRSMVLWAPLGLLLLMGIYVGVWILTARSAEADIRQWIADRRAEGYEVHHQGITTDGFPLGITLSIAKPEITAPEDLSGWSWTGPSLAALVSPLGGGLRLEARGTHHFDLPLGPRGRLVPISLSGAELSAKVALDPDGGLRKATLALRDVAVAGKPLGPMAIQALDLEMLDGPLYGKASAEEVFWSMVLEARGVTPPPSLRLGLDRMERLALSLRRFGEIPGGAFEQGLQTWQEEDGRLAIDSLSLNWPPLLLTGSGTVQLDDDLQPLVDVTAQTRGFFGLINGLARQGWARSADTRMARMMLSGMAADNTALNVAITTRQRALYAGPAKLMDLPTIHWGLKGARALDRVAPGFEINREGEVQRLDDEDTDPLPME